MSTEWTDASPAGADDIPGRVLKARREQMGWSVEQVADQLKLAPRQVLALEEGDYAALPPAAVVRGFVRAYAKVVKVDATPLVARIPLDAAAAAADAPAGVRARPQSFSEVRFPTSGKRSRMPLVAAALAVLAIAAVVVAWQAGLFDVGTDGAAGPQVSEPVAAPSLPSADGTVTEPVAAPALPPADPGAGALFPSQQGVPAATTPANGAAVPATGATPPASTQPAAPAGANPAPSTRPATPGVATPGVATPGVVTPPASAAAAPNAAAAPVAAGGKALVLNVNQESWVELSTASGKLLMARLAAPGTVESFDIREPVTLVVGNPAGVTATLRGASLALPARRGTTVARVKINP